ncbi:hypothetical protein [uncultured Fusobacterium sp.]|uniref:hypothetical protein n=1 Tax=uncultured Fusobacterium sp. TaxID=159267 RepID=UPI0027DD3004|nr:hypothetical protein [uncultured Fusobacterium sp.]
MNDEIFIREHRIVITNDAKRKDRERIQKEAENYSTEDLKKMLQKKKNELKTVKYKRENSSMITSDNTGEEKLEMEIDEIEKVLKNRE